MSLGDRLEESAAALKAKGGKVSVVPTDVTRKAEVDALAQAALDNHGRLDIWANVAAILRHNLVLDTSEEELDAVLAVNLKGVYFGCQAAGRAMVAGGGGSIINIASQGHGSSGAEHLGLRLDQGGGRHADPDRGRRARTDGCSGQRGGARLHPNTHDRLPLEQSGWDGRPATPA